MAGIFSCPRDGVKAFSLFSDYPTLLYTNAVRQPPASRRAWQSRNVQPDHPGHRGGKQKSALPQHLSHASATRQMSYRATMKWRYRALIENRCRDTATTRTALVATGCENDRVWPGRRQTRPDDGWHPAYTRPTPAETG